MLTIKSYRDGDRLVVVFEGLSNIPSDEDMIKSYISNITGVQAEPVKPVDAAPVPQDTKEVEIPEARFGSKSKYFGMTPKEVIAREGAKGFLYLTKAVYRPDYLPDDLKKDTEVVIKEYLNNFAECDAESYAKKLTDSQVDTFIHTYEYVMPDEVRDYFRHTSDADKRKVIADTIRSFQG